ncbi:MAG: ABC transporter ATP-binding protein [Bacillota bacterium]
MADIDNIFDVEEEEEEQEATKMPFNRGYFVRMMGYLKPYLSQTTIAGVLVFIGTLVNLAEPVLMKHAIDNGITKGNLTVLNQVLIALIVLRLVAWVASGRQIRIMNRTGQHILYDLRQELFDHIQKLSFNFYDSRPVGKIMSRITNDVNTMGEMINSGMINIVSQGISLIGIVIIMLSMHARLAVLAFLVLPPLILLFLNRQSSLEGLWLKVRKAVSNINAHLNETLTGIQVIQAFSRQKINSEKFDRINTANKRSYMKAVRVEILFWPIIDVVAALGTCLVIWFGAKEVIAGSLSLGTLMAFLTFLQKFWAPVNTFSRVYSQMLSAMASAERVFEFLDSKPLVVDAPDAVTLPTIKGEIRFEDVSFGYEADKPVLHDVSFTVRPGQTVALVGPTGAGKSTIINLVARFYDPTAGRILVDGHDLTKVTLASLRSQLGIVLQDTFIFSGTVKENIEYGRLGAALEQIEGAAQAANAHGFIAKMEKGYETETEERGNTLSTGQRQLLAFARALLADPRILILDEATSSIDTETERLIQNALQHLLQDRTSFVIAHRLSTIRNADLIMVVDGGRIVESGTHAELLAKRGTYWRLHDTQYRLQEKMSEEVSFGLSATAAAAAPR